MVAKRLDLSNYLIHFTKGENVDDENGAYANLKSIIQQKELKSNNGDIRGGYKCVCFTEAPIDCLKETCGIVCFDGQKKYSNYGLMIPKIDIYKIGGRPVIYSDEADFDLLPDKMKYRYVRFEPLKKIKDTNSNLDFTWEREWRINSSVDLRELSNYQIIVPSIELGTKLKEEAEKESYNLYKNCQNSKVEIVNYTELLNNECNPGYRDCCKKNIEYPRYKECPEPVRLDMDCIICMDKSC
jgi:hypothetical protein